ncbi:hypothetical protein, partial [Klebsiella pneumoniae]|uniref:hypothetical protein n=1 Tax=Klebsiella pneumoniae TaxID=573 RepID=UPI001C63D325
MEQSVSYRSDDDRAKLNALIDILSGDILLHTQHERDELINYYRNEGLLNNENYAIVDIGHNGTMQRSLFNLLGKQLVGYYFCTFSEIDKNITKDIGSAKGYIHDKLNPKTSAHSYSKNILMYEMAFLNNQGSFVRFHHGKPVYLSVRDEGKRVKFANDLHKGIIDFNIVLVSRYG